MIQKADPLNDHAARAPKRIVVGGTTASGKSTAASRIGGIIGAPHIELDALYWEPNWTPADPEVFRQRVAAATAGDSWVVDGGYSVVRDLTWGRADTFVWLDYAYPRVLARLSRRNVDRILKRQELWNDNRETLRGAFFSRDSLYVWQVKTHWDKRRKYPRVLHEPAYRHLRVVRARHPDELDRWIEHLRAEYAA